MSAGLDRSVPRGGIGFVLTSLSMSSLFAALLLPACGGSSAPEWPKGNVVLENENNFTSVTSLTIPTIQTASGADLTVCWDSLMKDLLCHDVVPTTNGIDNVGFLQIPNMSHDQVAAKLAVGQLDPNLVRIYRDYH